MDFNIAIYEFTNFHLIAATGADSCPTQWASSVGSFSSPGWPQQYSANQDKCIILQGSVRFGYETPDSNLTLFLFNLRLFIIDNMIYLSFFKLLLEKQLVFPVLKYIF